MSKSIAKNIRSLFPTIAYGCMIALFFTMMMGIFYNKVSESNFTSAYHYYIHRGYPTAYFGISAVDAKVPAHVVKIPYFKKQVSAGTEVIKVLNIHTFLISFMQYFVLGAIMGYVLSRFMRKRRTIQIFLAGWILSLTIMSFITLSRF